jgi:DNA ligase-4
MYFTRDVDREMIAANVDEFGDSYCQDFTVSTLRKLCESMKKPVERIDEAVFFSQLEDHGIDVDELPGNIFRRVVAYFDCGESDEEARFAEQIVTFANGKVVKTLDDVKITHIIVGNNKSRLDHIRVTISK